MSDTSARIYQMFVITMTLCIAALTVALLWATFTGPSKNARACDPALLDLDASALVCTDGHRVGTYRDMCGVARLRCMAVPE